MGSREVAKIAKDMRFQALRRRTQKWLMGPTGISFVLPKRATSVLAFLASWREMQAVVEVISLNTRNEHKRRQHHGTG